MWNTEFVPITLVMSLHGAVFNLFNNQHIMDTHQSKGVSEPARHEPLAGLTSVDWGPPVCLQGRKKQDANVSHYGMTAESWKEMKTVSVVISTLHTCILPHRLELPWGWLLWSPDVVRKGNSMKLGWGQRQDEKGGEERKRERLQPRLGSAITH